MFGRHKKQTSIPFDTRGKIPVIRASICTGEQVAGFKDPETGSFKELMLLQTPSDLQTFLREYGVKEEDIRREW